MTIVSFRVLYLDLIKVASENDIGQFFSSLFEKKTKTFE